MIKCAKEHQNNKLVVSLKKPEQRTRMFLKGSFSCSQNVVIKESTQELDITQRATPKSGFHWNKQNNSGYSDKHSWLMLINQL